MEERNAGKKTTYGKVLGSFKMKCPFCGGDMVVTETQYDVPGMGPVIIVNKVCTKCGYRRNDVIPLRSEGHKRIYYKVEGERDYEAKVIRSPYARIKIPELGLEMEPGIDAEMFVTNIEGILRMFIDAAERIRAMEGGEETEEERRLREKVEHLGGGFTVVIDDREGLSKIENADRRKLLVEEVDGAKSG